MIDARIKIRHLQCFLGTARLRDVGRAADRLGVTLPALDSRPALWSSCRSISTVPQDRSG
jgi:hypothetical protein